MSGLELLIPEHRRLFIGGSWREANSGATFSVRDPADGSVIADVADGDVNDAVDALDAAAEVQQDWGTTAPRERGEILRRAFELITERADDFAELMSLEMGKTVKEAKGEVTYGAEFFRWFSEEAVRIHGRWMQAPAGGSRLLTIRKPVGPCLFITPWNFPLAMGTRKIGPAIAAGCTMVVKPAELTPLTMLALAATLEEVGLPAGVLNVVTTSDSKSLSKALMADDRLRKVSFTGSTAVGKVIVRQSADELQRVSMELGGNAPFLVFEDADVDAAVDGAMIAKMRNMGEACTAANRFLVHESVADEFAEKLGARMGALVVGRGQDDGRRRRPADRPERRRLGQPARHRRRPRRRPPRRRRQAAGDGTRAPSTRPPCCVDVPRRVRDRAAGDLRARSPRSPPSPARTRRSTAPTTPSTGWRPTSTPATSPGPSGSPSGCSSGWSASTPA